MSLEYHKIGETAGKIYKLLEEKGEQSTTKIKKDAKVTDAALFNQALGWLAREGQIAFNESGKGNKVSLKK